MNCRTCSIEGHDSQGDKALCLAAVTPKYREAVKMALILLDYIHILKHHPGRLENCEQEPCAGTIEFLGTSDVVQ